MQIHSVGIDLDKSTFQLVAPSAAGKVLLRKRFTQKQLIAFTDNLQTSLIGTEACSACSRKRNLKALLAWLGAARTTALSGFATGLERDISAVREALRLPWNQGDVEGQVHRLKLIKRQKYGRAGFDLLRLRVFQQG